MGKGPGYLPPRSRYVFTIMSNCCLFHVETAWQGITPVRLQAFSVSFYRELN